MVDIVPLKYNTIKDYMFAHLSEYGINLTGNILWSAEVNSDLILLAYVVCEKPVIGRYILFNTLKETYKITNKEPMLDQHNHAFTILNVDSSNVTQWFRENEGRFNV